MSEAQLFLESLTNEKLSLSLSFPIILLKNALNKGIGAPLNSLKHLFWEAYQMRNGHMAAIWSSPYLALSVSFFFLEKAFKKGRKALLVA